MLLSLRKSIYKVNGCNKRKTPTPPSFKSMLIRILRRYARENIYTYTFNMLNQIIP